MAKPFTKPKNWFFEIGYLIIMGGGIVLLLRLNHPILAGLMMLCIVGIIYRDRKEIARQQRMKVAILQPGQVIGEIVLGEAIEKYKSKKLEYTNSTHDYYSFEDYNVLAAVNDQGIIDAVQCDSDCIWQGVNLIGLHHKEFTELYPYPPNRTGQVSIQTEYGKQMGDLYDYDGLGLQLWIYKKQILSLRVRRKFVISSSEPHQQKP